MIIIVRFISIYCREYFLIVFHGGIDGMVHWWHYIVTLSVKFN